MQGHDRNDVQPVSTWERLGMIAGIAFIVALMAAIFAAPTLAQYDAPLDQLALTYTKNANGHLLSTFFSGIAALLFLGFLGSLASVLRRSTRDSGPLPRIIIAAGTASITMVLVAQGVYAATAMAATAEGMTPPVIRALDTIVFASMQFSAFPQVVLLLAAGISMIQSAAAPRWVGWAGVIIAVVKLVGTGTILENDGGEGLFGLFAFLGVLLFGLWTLMVSIAYLRAGNVQRPVTEATAA